jgi:hypothetical protein
MKVGREGDGNASRNMKTWIFYVILAWQVGPLMPVEHKTLLLQFDSLKECLSIADQVDSQVKQLNSIFRLKQISCLSCESLYGKQQCRKKGS